MEWVALLYKLDWQGICCLNSCTGRNMQCLLPKKKIATSPRSQISSCSPANAKEIDGWWLVWKRASLLTEAITMSTFFTAAVRVKPSAAKFCQHKWDALSSFLGCPRSNLSYMPGSNGTVQRQQCWFLRIQHTNTYAYCSDDSFFSSPPIVSASCILNPKRYED